MKNQAFYSIEKKPLHCDCFYGHENHWKNGKKKEKNLGKQRKEANKHA